MEEACVHCESGLDFLADLAWLAGCLSRSVEDFCLVFACRILDAADALA